MLPSATPATWNEGGCRQVPRLPRKVPRRHGPLKCRWMSPTATLATQSAAAPRATNGPQARPPDPAQCHKCHAWKLMSPSATPATWNEGGCRQVPRLPHKVPRRHGPLKCRWMSPTATLATQSAAAPRATNGPQARPPDPAQCHRCRACHAKRILVVYDKAVCDKVVCERWCVTKMVCDKVVCERWCVTKMVCERWCVTKLCVRKLRVRVWQSCVCVSCVWEMVCVCDTVVYERWCVTKLSVKDGVWQSCVIMTKLCMTKLCVCESCVWQSCVWQSCAWQSCVWQSCACVKDGVGKMVRDKVECNKSCVWQSCVWQSCVWKMVWMKDGVWQSWD